MSRLWHWSPLRIRKNVYTQLTSNVGLTKAAPVSRRGFTSASAEAGYTLAAGPVRTEAIAPVLALYGAAGRGISVASVEALKQALAKANKPAAFKIYLDAPQGFHADYRPSYRKEAAEGAWKQMQGWFSKYNVLS